MKKQKRLGARTHRILEQMSEQIIPSGGQEYPGTGEMNLPGMIIAKMGALSGGLVFLRVFLWWWELSPFFFSLRFRRFTAMSAEQQIAYLESWEQSRFYFRRMIMLFTKGLFMVHFYNDPAVWEKIGYTGECLVKSEGGAE